MARVHHAAPWQRSLAARDRSPAQHFADMEGGGQDLYLLVGLSRPDLRNRKTRQINNSSRVGRHHASEITPVSTGILGRLWRVPVLGGAFKESI